MDVVSYLLGKQAGGGAGSLQAKSVSITQNGETTISPDEGYTGLSSVVVTTNVTSALQTRSITITTNGTTTVTPETGYQGISSIEITTNVGSTYDWNSLGFPNDPDFISRTYTYTANIKANWNPALTDRHQQYMGNNYIFVFPNVDMSNVTSMANMFQSSVLRSVAYLNTSSCTDMSNAFNSTYIETIDLDTSSLQNAKQMFMFVSALKNVPVLASSNITDMSNMFSNCNNLTDDSLNNIMKMCINATSYTGTKNLNTLGINATLRNRCPSLSNYAAFIAAGWTLQ